MIFETHVALTCITLDSRYGIRVAGVLLSHKLLITGKTDIGRKSFGEEGLLTFGTGLILATFEYSGNVPKEIKLLMIKVSGEIINSLTGFNRLIGMES